MLKEQRDRLCLIVGASPDELPGGWDESDETALELRFSLTKEVARLARDGASFLSPLEPGAAMWGAEAALVLRRETGCGVICAPIGETQAERWCEGLRNRYFRLLERSDETVERFGEPLIEGVLTGLADRVIAVEPLSMQAQMVVMLAKQRGLPVTFLREENAAENRS